MGAFSANSVILVIYLTCGIFGNSTVFFVYKFKMNLIISKQSRFFIPFLAISDFLTCVTGSIFALLNGDLNVIRGEVACDIWWFTSLWFTILSTLMLLIIAVERYRKVCKPFGMQIQVHTKYIAMVVAVMISCIASVPSIFFVGEINFDIRGKNITGRICGLHPDTTSKHFVYNMGILIFAIVNIGSIAMLYILVIRQIFRQIQFRSRTKIKPLSHSVGNMGSRKDVSTIPDVLPNNDKIQEDQLNRKLPRTLKSIRRLTSQNESKFRFSLLFFGIFVLYVLSYLPRVIIMIIESSKENFWKNLTDDEYRGFLFMYRFYIFHSVVNPILYAAFDSEFRNEFKHLCYCKTDLSR